MSDPLLCSCPECEKYLASVTRERIRLRWRLIARDGVLILAGGVIGGLVALAGAAILGAM